MSRVSNLLGAVPLIVWYGWGLSREIPTFMRNYVSLGGSSASALLALQLIAQAAAIAFTAFLIVLLIVRAVPKAQAAGFVPYLASFIGTFATASFFFLPSAVLSIPLLLFSTFCLVAGLGLCVYALIYLGRSFAILPSARALIMSGPYRFVRHPLYLFEEIAIIGAILQFIQPWSFLLAAVQFIAQLVRMKYEEKILTDAFPEYAAYAARTARLIPGIY